MTDFAKDCDLLAYLDGKAIQDDGRVHLDISMPELEQLRAAMRASANVPQTPSEREIALAIFTRRSGLHPKRAAEIFEEPPPWDVDVIEALLDAEAVLALSRPHHQEGRK